VHGSSEGYTKGVNKEADMGQAYELDSELYNNVEEFLDACAHAYKTGDKELIVDTLENYGFSLSDINVRPDGA
jgi:hypothetical protein